MNGEPVLMFHFLSKKAKCLLMSLVFVEASFVNASTNENPNSPNFLLIIADDLGVDALDLYGFSSDTANTPTLDSLARSGLTFDNFWATPACTTTRGALISGLHGYVSDVDYVPAILPDDTHTIQQRLKQDDLAQAYATGVFGKWHLGGRKPVLNHPSQFGVDIYAGNLFNLEDYYSWTLTQNGEQSKESRYHTTAVTDLAVDFIRSNSGSPWFAWVAYSAPHEPFHEPPANLISAETSLNSPAEKYKAMIEAMDTEIGRMIAALPEEDKDNTYIVFMGDNGTPRRTRDPQVFDKDHVKGSLYEGGIRVPLIISGQGVVRQGDRDSSLVNATDLFATFTALALGVDSPSQVPSSSISFASRITGGLDELETSQRQYNYSEWRTRRTDVSWTVRGQDYKVIQHHNGDVELFATKDINEETPIQNAAIEAKLLSLGEQIRSGGYYK